MHLYGTAIYQLIALFIPLLTIALIVWFVISINKMNKRLEGIERNIEKIIRVEPASDEKEQ